VTFDTDLWWRFSHFWDKKNAQDLKITGQIITAH